MPAIVGLLLPGLKLLTRVPLVGAIFCALGLIGVLWLAAVLLALRLGGLVLRIVFRGPLIGVPLLAILMGYGLVPAYPSRVAGLEGLKSVQREALASYQTAIGGILPARVAVVAQKVRDYAREALPQLVAPSPQRPARTTIWVAIAHTDGAGAYVRATPRLTNHLQAWAEGTRLEVVGEDISGDGHRWKRVRDPFGQLGWVAAEFVIPTTAP